MLMLRRGVFGHGSSCIFGRCASTADGPLDGDLALAQELLPGFGLGFLT